jgi:hypothetical protein
VIGEKEEYERASELVPLHVVVDRLISCAGVHVCSCRSRQGVQAKTGTELKVLL